MRKLAAALSAFFVFGIALAGVSTPFKGWGSAVVVGVNPQPTYTELTIVGSGQATHLGRFSRFEVVQINGTGGFTGTIVYTAANGDMVDVSFTGQFISATDAVGTYIITGGTGRFAGASGSANFTAFSADFVNVTFTFDGNIS